MDKQTTNIHLHLTDREKEILILFARGFNPKEVSKKLDIQPKTVHAHKENLFKKMNFNNHRQLMSFALTNKLITLDDLIVDQ